MRGRGEERFLAQFRHTGFPEPCEWTEANGYKTAGDLYERYSVGPETSPDPANWRTELSRALIAASDSFHANSQ